MQRQLDYFGAPAIKLVSATLGIAILIALVVFLLLREQRYSFVANVDALSQCDICDYAMHWPCSSGVCVLSKTKCSEDSDCLLRPGFYQGLTFLGVDADQSGFSQLDVSGAATLVSDPSTATGYGVAVGGGQYRATVAEPYASTSKLKTNAGLTVNDGFSVTDGGVAATKSLTVDGVLGLGDFEQGRARRCSGS